MFQRPNLVVQLRNLLTNRLQNGTEMIPVDVAPDENPWLTMAGIFDPADPLIKKWKKAMAEYRREVEDDPDYL